MFFLEYPGNIFAIVEPRLQGKVKKCTIRGHEQMGEILDPIGYDKLIDGGTHRLFKLHLQVATRQRHKLGQAIDIDVAREVILDKVHYLRDIFVGDVKLFCGLPEFEPSGLDDDIEGLFDGTTNHSIYQPTGFIPSLLYIRDDGRYGWIGQVTNQLVVIHA